MLTAVSAAVIAAVASLVGVTLGALLEPWKLNAARRAKLRQDRADRCGGFIEAAARARQHLISLNVSHRQHKLDKGGVERVAGYEDDYYAARAEMRSLLGLLVMSGPDELVSAAKNVRKKDMDLHGVRHDLDEGAEFDRQLLPPAVRTAVVALDRAIEDFAVVARKHTS